MTKGNFLTWSILVLLTLSGYYAAGHLGAKVLAPLLCVSAAAKVLLVGFQFMELKKAHAAWRGLLLLILVLYMGLVLGLS